MEELIGKLGASKMYGPEDEYQELWEFANIKKEEYTTQVLIKDKLRIQRYDREMVLESVFDPKVMQEIKDIFLQENDMDYIYKISKEISRVIMEKLKIAIKIPRY